MLKRRFSSDLQRRHNGDVSEREGENVIDLLKEIVKMSDEDFNVLCMAASQDYGESVKEKLCLIRYQTKSL